MSGPIEFLKAVATRSRVASDNELLVAENAKLRQVVADLIEAFSREALGQKQWIAMQEAKRLIGRET